MKSFQIDLRAKKNKSLSESLAPPSGETGTKAFTKILDEEIKPKDKNIQREKNSLEEEKGESKEKQDDPKPVMQAKIQDAEHEFSPLRRFLYEMVYRDPAIWSIADRQFYHVDKNQNGLSHVRRILSERPMRLAPSSDEKVDEAARQSLTRQERSFKDPASQESTLSQEQSPIVQHPFIHFRTSLSEIEKREGVKESRILEQVLDQLSLREIKGGSVVSLVLKPEALGEVHLELIVQGNQVTAKFQTSNRRVGEVLKAHFSELSQAFSKHGLEVKTLEVEKIK